MHFIVNFSMNPKLIMSILRQRFERQTSTRSKRVSSFNILLTKTIFDDVAKYVHKMKSNKHAILNTLCHKFFSTIVVLLSDCVVCINISLKFALSKSYDCEFLS